MEKREATWRTGFLHREVGFVPAALCTGPGKKPSFKRRKICPPDPQALTGRPSLPSLLGKELPAVGYDADHEVFFFTSL